MLRLPPADSIVTRQKPPQRRFSLRSGRHPDYINLSANPLQPAEVKDRPNLEADVRYRRVDYSRELAREARYEFARCLAAGETSIPLAAAALLIAAEDDAIASSSTVRFPVDAFLDRITKLAQDIAHKLEAAAAAAQPSSSSSSSSSSDPGSSRRSWPHLRSLPPEQVIAAVEHQLFTKPQPQQQQQQWYTAISSWRSGFSMPSYGRSNLPRKTLIDHPGVWEDARLGYLNEVLVRRRGCPAVLVILYAEIMQQLMMMGAIDVAVTFNYRNFNELPSATPLANLGLINFSPQQQQNATPTSSSSSSSIWTSPRILNTCSSDALAEILRHLKRSYWPFPWNTNVDDPDHGGLASLGGFRGAAKSALGSQDISAALRAVSATAQHRLQRGIWTSPGGGDLIRCVAAAERLVMMVGEQQTAERRDLAVLLLHAGQPSAAAAELSAYLDSVKYTSSSSSSSGADPFDVKLANDLWKMISQDYGIKPDRELMSVEKILSRGVDNDIAEGDEEAAYKPLTW